MIGKITTILAAAALLTSAGVASAQTNRHARVQWQAQETLSEPSLARHIRQPQTMSGVSFIALIELMV